MSPVLARELRKNQIPEEKKLWEVVRNRKLDGKEFLREHIIPFQSGGSHSDFFIADSCCEELRLIIEPDGRGHDTQRDEDDNRDAVLTDLGFTTIRLPNSEPGDFGKVLDSIKAFWTHPRPAATPSLRAERGPGGEFFLLLLIFLTATYMGQTIHSQQILIKK